MALSNKIDAFAGNLELASKVAIEYKNFLNETIYRRIRRCCTNQQERLFGFIFEESNEKKNMNNIPLSSVTSCAKFQIDEYIRALTRKAIDR